MGLRLTILISVCWPGLGCLLLSCLQFPTHLSLPLAPLSSSAFSWPESAAGQARPAQLTTREINNISHRIGSELDYSDYLIITPLIKRMMTC